MRNIISEITPIANSKKIVANLFNPFSILLYVAAGLSFGLYSYDT